MATTHRITNVIKVAEFADLYESFITMDKSEQCYWNVIELIQQQTEAKQAKWWAYFDARQGVPTLTCEECKATSEVLAHQNRSTGTVKVCLDCADRHYQNELTKRLIEAEKVGA